MKKFTLEDIKEEYNDKSIVRAYADQVDGIGLWNIEKWVFDKYVKKDDKILNIGCGAGRETIPLYELGWHNIIGADLSQGMIDQAQLFAKEKELEIQFEVQDVISLPYEEANFDCVFLSANIIMCVPSFALREKAIEEIHRILKDGGIAIFIIWDKDALEEQEFDDFAKVDVTEKYDLEKGDIVSAHYNLKESYLHEAEPDYLPTLLREKDFKIELMDYCDNIVPHSEKEIYTKLSKIIIAKKCPASNKTTNHN